MENDPKQPLRILLLEDEPTDAELVEAELREAGLHFVSLRVDTRDGFVRALDEFRPDIVLSDFRLPAFDGESAIKIVRERHPTVPVVMVTGAVGDEKAIELLKLGARDYVLKDRLARLPPVVERALSEERSIRARKAAEKALRESKARYEAIMQSANDAIACMKPDGTIHLWNKKSEEIFGYTAEEAIGQPLHQLITPVRYREKQTEGMQKFRATGTGYAVGNTLELVALHKNGNEFPVELSVSAMNINGEWHATGIIRDITERRQAQARIQKLAQLYAMLSKTNTIIVHSANRDSLLSDICKAAVEDGKFIMAWVGLADDAAQRIIPVCHHGAEQGYLADILTSAGGTLADRGPTSIAIRENRISYINDLATDGRTLPWHEVALHRGFRSYVGLPLRLHGKVIGALSIYSGESDFFDAEQLDLMSEMSGDISFALDGFEREAQRQKAEEERETALEKLQNAFEGSIQLAASIAEKRDPYTAGHQQRVSELAVAIAREMGLEPERIESIRFGSLIHDIGKIGVPAEILSKPSRLTSMEMELIRAHVMIGYETVKDIEFPWPIAQMILQHHERLDGSGYPSGLKEADIILEARIIAVADTVEAMSSHRPYRPGRGVDVALEEIVAGRGKYFDKQVVDNCMRLFREKGYTFKFNSS